MKTSMASVLFALAAAGLGSAHMAMIDPPPFRSKNNPHAQQVDYDMTSPLGVFPCKGYHTDFGTAAGASVATWAAGSTQKVTISGGAAHGGGSCQVSLSFDKGSTFKVIHSYIGNCPLGGESSFPFTVPTESESGDAIVAWSWFNKIGNREMYMNCAAVTITGGSGTGLASMPDIFVANIPAAGTCGTSEGADVMFPNPGAFVDNSSTGTAPPTGNCPASVPGGGGDGNNNPSPAAPAVTSTATPMTSTLYVATTTTSDDMGDMGDMGATSTTAVVGATSVAVTTTTSDDMGGMGDMDATSVDTSTTMSATSVAAYTTISSDGSSSTTVNFITVKPTITGENSATFSETPGGVFVPSPSHAATTFSTLTKTATGKVTNPTGSTGSTFPATSEGTQTVGADCATEGQWNCIGGTAFQRCASGKWSPVQSMAAGTACSPGLSAKLWAKRHNRHNRRIHVA